MFRVSENQTIGCGLKGFFLLLGVMMLLDIGLFLLANVRRISSSRRIIMKSGGSWTGVGVSFGCSGVFESVEKAV